MGKLWVFEFSMLFLFATKNLCSGADNTSFGCLEHERRALLRFKHSLALDPSGRLLSWNENNCCHWQHVGCDNVTRHVTSLDIRIDYSTNQWQDMGSELDSSLAELTRLSYLDLSGIKFRSSPIPEFIGSMTQLRFLNLSNAGFSGVVPHWIRNLSSLRELSLGENMELVVDDFTWFSSLLALEHLDLSGLSLCEAPNLDKVLLDMILSLQSLRLSGCKLTNSHFNRTHLHSNLTLSAIQTLDLSYNLFEGEFPLFLQNLTSLQVLDLSYNRLNASIPVMNGVLVELYLEGNRFTRFQDIGVWRLCQIKVLDLSDNYMEGELIGPTTECALYALEKLYLSRNKFSGKIPRSLERLTALRVLYLDKNDLTGRIPESLGDLSNLRELDLSTNQLTGLIPFSLRRLAKLEILYLNSNSLFSIPSWIGNLSELRYLDLSTNLLQGPLPNTMGQLSKLLYLDISNNSLSGVVTEAHFANTSMLKHLAATSNHRLSFKISADWKPPFQIRNVMLGSCKIESDFPPWIQTQRSIEILNVSNTSIFGTLPGWFHELPIFVILDLSHNFLEGPLTNLPWNLTTKSSLSDSYEERLQKYERELGVLLLKNNLFNGSIPDSVCNATHFFILDLSRNMLSGTIPGCLGNLSQLMVIIVSSNRLSGVIPSSLGNLGPSLNWLLLNNNSFHGEVPKTLADCTNLNVLDLGENRFSGSIPKWIDKKITTLSILRLHKNNFSGRIPVELCRCTNLQIMDLGENNLTGKIPGCFQNLSGMTKPGGYNIYFYSEFERSLIQIIKGTPLEYTNIMTYVVNMDLSSNKLVGEIPEKLVLLAGLMGLNLSNNNLTGRIPDRIGDMHSLMSLDLSGNHLSGMIPQSLSALTFLSHLNLSHNNLSGQIPTGSQLQTLTDPSIYAGNNELCGSPLPTNCKRDQVPEYERKDKEDEGGEKMWICGATSGFMTGFLGILGILALNNRWRLALLKLVGSFIGRKT